MKIVQPNEKTNSQNIHVLLGLLREQEVNYISIKTFYDNSATLLCRDLAEDITKRRPHTLCLGISMNSRGSCFVSVFAIDLTDPLILDDLRFLSDSKYKLVGHNLKEDALSLHSLGLRLHENVYDTYIAETHLSLGAFDELIERERALLGTCPAPADEISFELWSKRFLADQFSINQLALQYLCNDEDAEILRGLSTGAPWSFISAISKIYFAQSSRLVASGVQSFLEQTAFPLIPHLADVTLRGIRVDRASLLQARTIVQECQNLKVSELQRAYGLTNPKSEVQVKDLFMRRNLRPFFESNGGKINFEKDALRRVVQRLGVSGQHEDARLAQEVLSARANAHLLSQIENLIGMADDCDHIHPDLIQYGTKTMRIWEQWSNLDKRVSNAILPSREDCGIGECDISGADIFVMAALSGDFGLQQTYSAPGDVYLRTGAVVFPSEFTSNDIALIEAGGILPPDRAEALKGARLLAKETLLSVAYGQTAEGVARKCNKSVSSVTNGISRLRSQYPRLFESIEEQVTSIRCSHRVQLPSVRITLSDKRIENRARNYPFQTTTALVFNKALLEVFRFLKMKGGRVLFTIYDSIVYEAPVERLKECSEGIQMLLQLTFSAAFPECLATLKVKTDISNPAFWARGNGRALEDHLEILQGEINAARRCQMLN